ncbi:MAG: electron transfer flavoprotein subunit beta/FixA family protein [Saprospiraceae bacterium]
MKTLVCISKTPDTTSKISFVDGGKNFNSDGISFIMNPYDEWYALVRAVELKEKMGGTVTVINVGDASNDLVIRKALAIGADDAVRVNANAPSSFFVAKQIAEIAKKENYDLIFLGKETIDYNGAEVGAQLAELLDLPFFSFVNHLEVDGQTNILKREIEGGEETIKVSGPCVISAAKDLAQQRIPNMQGIMMSKRKPLTVVEAVAVEELVSLITHELPLPKKGVTLVSADNVDELVRLLHEEAKVI